MTTQPTPTITSDDVDRVVGRDFSAERSEDIFALLAEYGEEEWHREIDRVRLAALKLAAGDFARLRTVMESAKCDYRDVLALAEYPAYSQKVRPSAKPSDEETQRIIEADWRQYCDWLAR